MNTFPHDFVTVDMRGLKTALVGRAQAERVSVSVLVRRAVAKEIGSAVPGSPLQADVPSNGTPSAVSVKLSIRMTSDEAMRLATGARAAGMSRGAYLAGLVADVPVLTSGGTRAEHLAALTASNAELSTLSRNIHRLTSFLRQGSAESAKPYRDMLDMVAGDVHSHLKVAASLLTGLRPQRHGGRPTARSGKTQQEAT